MYVAAPPFVGVAVNLIDSLAHIVFLDAVILTAGTIVPVTVIILGVDTIVLGFAQASELVISTEYESPFVASVVE